MIRPIAAVTLGLWVATLAGPVRAEQPGEGDGDVVVAAETFRAGTAAYERGDFETAARSFEVSHRLAPHPFALYNAGLAWQAATKLERAADALAAALGLGGLTEGQRLDAQARLADLRGSLGWVEIEAPADALVSIGHAERVAAPARVHLPAGDHNLEVRWGDGRTETRRVTVQIGKASAVVLAPRRVEPAPAAVPVVGPEQGPPPASGSGNVGLVVGGWITLGVGVAAGAAAIGMGTAALKARDDFEASANTDAGAHDRAATLRTATNVAWAGAGVLALGGVLMLVFGYGDADDSARSGRPGRIATTTRLRFGPSSAALEF